MLQKTANPLGRECYVCTKELNLVGSTQQILITIFIKSLAFSMMGEGKEGRKESGAKNCKKTKIKNWFYM